ncbi:universal stress protein [Alicyclobacillus ferrooxydans]|uniref:Histidine kinase n=1 Tax=Alicyclobacillus ferrooxydans TaxID=471514 RepID=A0A0P9C9T8_9BACL|nr:universal stress protein [Alicyclobacillus ferrooxydans]KPV41958.1 histidine kinase [Alicyclobacillus ferrooxydans]
MSIQHQRGGAASLRRGRLTIYVGAAPGVGKTYKMLQDANDWKRKGTDVVIGLIETHGRGETARQVADLESVSLRTVTFEGHEYQELNVDGILQRSPHTVLIDELAHTNVPGCERTKRYEDIDYILDHGINVVTAVNIQHLESLHDKVEHITGVKVRERIPDWFMDMADEVKLIDVTPETLQLRLTNGKIYARDKIQRALENFFQPGNLSALRELALLEVADDVDQRMDKERKQTNVESSLYGDPNRDRILVCVNYRPHSEKLIRRGWRIADRLDAELYVLVVLPSAKLSDTEKKELRRVQKLSEEFDGIFITTTEKEGGIGATIVAVAQQLDISQIVIGQPVMSDRWLDRMKRTPVDYVLENAEFVDLHVVAHTRT